MYIELYNKFALDCHYLKVPETELSAATKAVAQVGLERFGENFDSIAYEFSQRVEYLLKDKFPFTKVTDKVAKEALTIPVPKFFYADDILSAMLKSPEASFEEMQVIVDNMSSNCIEEVFRENYRDCFNNRISGCGYSVHLLLKLAIYPEYELPDPSVCDSKSLDPAIKLCLSKCRYTPRLLEFIFPLVRRETGIFVEHVPDFKALMGFVAITNWLRKGEVLVDIFMKFPKEAKTILLPILKESPFTGEMANCFEQAFAAKSLAELYPILGRLIDFLPNLDEFEIKSLFKCPYPKVFRNEADPAATCRLSGLIRPKVVTHGSIMVGLHEEKTLIAFDTKTTKLVWGLNLTKEPLHWGISPFGLVIVNKLSRDLEIYNPLNGERNGVIELPGVPNDFDSIHFAKDGFCYFGCLTAATVYGGRIASGKWEPVFQIPSPPYYFEPLGDFLTTRDDEGNYHIINQSGGVTRVADCRSLGIKNNYLYKIDKSRVLSRQAISASGHLSGVRLDMPLVTNKASLIDVCDDGTVVCYLDEVFFQDGYPSFVDMVKKRVVKVKEPLSAQFVDAKTSTLWTWNNGLQTLSKHTKEGSVVVGTLKGGRGITFLHAGEKLYFTNISY